MQAEGRDPGLNGGIDDRDPDSAPPHPGCTGNNGVGVIYCFGPACICREQSTPTPFFPLGAPGASRGEVRRRGSKLRCRSSKVRSRSSEVRSRSSEARSRSSELRCRGSEVRCRGSELRCRGSELRCRSSELRCRGSELRCRSSEVRCRSSEVRRRSFELRRPGSMPGYRADKSRRYALSVTRAPVALPDAQRAASGRWLGLHPPLQRGNEGDLTWVGLRGHLINPPQPPFFKGRS
jgi:hypothetical protein